jgi:uncharacterized protein (DUF58 family)
MFHTRLTREGWYFLIVLAFIVVGGSMREINLMLVLAGMMVGMLYFNWRVARSMLRYLEIRRRLPDSAHAGDWFTVELKASSSSRATAIAVEDPIQPLHAARGAEVRALALIPQVLPGESTRTQYRVQLDRRGRYQFGPLRITTRHPFGLISRTVRRPELGQLLVLPRLGRLTPDWARLGPSPEHGSRRTSGRQGQSEGDFYGLRDWRAGDSRRLVHWRTSARRGGLMVRQFERPRSENLTLLVELWQPAAPTADDERRVELAISLAATAALDACRRGESQLRVVTAGREVNASDGRASKTLAREILAHLALAEAGADNRLDDLLDHTSNGERRSGLTVLVSTRPTGQAAGARSSAMTNRLRASEVVTLVAGSDEFFRYFQLPAPLANGGSGALPTSLAAGGRGVGDNG